MKIKLLPTCLVMIGIFFCSFLSAQSVNIDIIQPNSSLSLDGSITAVVMSSDGTTPVALSLRYF